MRVILFSDSKDYMAVLRHQLAAIDDKVEVTEYDPEQHGRPSASFKWHLYDALIIEERLNAHESGLAWVSRFQQYPNLPPTIILGESHDPFVLVKASDYRNTEYVVKSELNAERLKELLDQIGATEPKDSTLPLQGGTYDQDRRIFVDIANREGLVDGGYKFVRLIGQGAHSRVYLAERLADKKNLVLKIIDLDLLEDFLQADRFAQEAQIVGSLDSPYIVKFFDHDFTSSYGYIAVEFFSRGDLKQRIEHGISTAQALLYTLNIAYGLEVIHTHEIVHRDIKPANIMFRADGSLAIADFGISKFLSENMDFTKTGSILGTLNYLSPEQGLGGEVDQRADLYALGVMMFEMLAGEKPFSASSPSALVYQHLYADPPELPTTLVRYQPIIDKLLQKNPDDRYQTASELVANLLPLCRK